MITLLILGAYVVIVEDRPPILRAALMITAYLLGRMMFRRTHALNALGVAALAILFLQPSALGDTSFLLSFVAAGTIGGVAVPLLERTSQRYRQALKHLSDVTRDGAQPPQVTQFRLDVRAAAGWVRERIPASCSRFATSLATAPCHLALRLWEIMVLTLVIQIGILPLMALYFHRVTLVGPLANVPAILLTAIIMPLGFVALSASLIWSALGHALGLVLASFIGALVAWTDWFARFPWSSYRVPTPPWALLAVFFAVLIVCSVAILTGRRLALWIASLSTLALTLLIAVHPFAPQLSSGLLEVTVLDVGQGDSIFVAFPDGRTMLVDGGGLPGGSYLRGIRTGIDIGENVVSPFLWTRGLKRIDVLVLTHAHQDHLGGLAAILRNFRVGELWVGRDTESPAYRALIGEARARGVPVVHRKRGDAFEWAGTQVCVLWPASSDPSESASNSDSLVLRLQHGGEVFLLAGDIERQVESILAGDSEPLRADFLKIPHHGSRTSTTGEFLGAVGPRFVAVSVGESNPFGHPSPEVLERIESEGSRLYRTDRDGAITTLAGDKGMEVRAFLEQR